MLFERFPTVYEAHGYFHSTLTPPLVVAIFLGIFWKRFTPAAVISSFLGGVTLMILGGNYPAILIAPFDHGIQMDPVHPYTYIRALYNLVVCSFVAVGITYLTPWLKNTVLKIKEKQNDAFVFKSFTILAAIIFVGLVFSSSFFYLHPDSILEISIMLFFALLMTVLVALVSTYYIKYDEYKHIEGLTAWSIKKAKEMFKGRPLNEEEGEIIKVKLKEIDKSDDKVYFSRQDMQRMKAQPGDLVYYFSFFLI